MKTRVVDLGKLKGGMSAITDRALDDLIVVARKAGDAKIVVKSRGTVVDFPFRGRRVLEIDVADPDGAEYLTGRAHGGWGE